MIPPFISRFFGDSSIPVAPRIDELERAAAEENERNRIRHIAQADTAHGAPRRTYTSDPGRPSDVRIAAEPVRRGDTLDLFNRADQSCERCGGMGRISVVPASPDGLYRAWVECDCLAAR